MLVNLGASLKVFHESPTGSPVNGCRIYSFDDELAKFGKTLRERIRNYVRDSKIPHRFIAANLDNDYYRILRGEEVVVIPQSDPQYFALAQEFKLARDEALIALVNKKDHISKIRRILLQFKR